jgi:hypothetical protein
MGSSKPAGPALEASIRQETGPSLAGRGLSGPTRVGM